jgi:apolipoprotein D and lipocalin family protein
VLNSCRKGGLAGKDEIAEGRAEVVDGSQNARLRVSFFGPFYGDYWVLDHAPDYSWSIVGEPSGRYLWLLSRTPHPSATTLRNIEEKATAMGYDLSLLRRTAQP